MAWTRMVALTVLVAAPGWGCTMIGIAVGATSAEPHYERATREDWDALEEGDDVGWRLRGGGEVRGTVQSRVRLEGSQLVYVRAEHGRLGPTTRAFGLQDVASMEHEDVAGSALVGGLIGLFLDAAVVGVITYLALRNFADSNMFGGSDCYDC